VRRGEEGLAVFGDLLRKEGEPQEVPLSKQSKLARSSRELHRELLQLRARMAAIRGDRPEMGG
jgi:hypothetical protein